MGTNNPAILVVFGTRPEAIKLCPLIQQLKARQKSVAVCVTAQHRDLLDQVLRHFDVQPEYDLNLMTPGQTLAALTARILDEIAPLIRRLQPGLVVVQGDTTTTMAAALAAFYERVPCAHVEAGLRTGDLSQPFPEELNRVLTTRVADLHFAPTQRSAGNLLREGIALERVFVTGNTGIDALLYTQQLLVEGRTAGFSDPRLDPSKRLLLVTSHRRESFGAGFESICEALRQLAGRGDVQVVYPVHPNPSVRSVVLPALGNIPGILLLDPLEYVPFVDLMRRAEIILTDSGGIQEEAPSLGKPVLVLREKTERQEAVDAGTATLVGTDAAVIVAKTQELLDRGSGKKPVTTPKNPFGDGTAAAQIAGIIRSFLKL